MVARGRARQLRHRRWQACRCKRPVHVRVEGTVGQQAGPAGGHGRARREGCCIPPRHARQVAAGKRLPDQHEAGCMPMAACRREHRLGRCRGTCPGPAHTRRQCRRYKALNLRHHGTTPADLGRCDQLRCAAWPALQRWIAAERPARGAMLSLEGWGVGVQGYWRAGAWPAAATRGRWRHCSSPCPSAHTNL